MLFLDEPTVGMDNQEKFGEILRKLREATTGKTVIVVDHDVNWLLQFCDYFVVLDQGKIVEQGTMQELLSRKGLLYDLYTITLGPKTAEIAGLIAGYKRRHMPEELKGKKPDTEGGKAKAEEEGRRPHATLHLL